MILLINNEIDYTTDNICLWLKKFNKKFFRIQSTKLISQVFSDILAENKIGLINEVVSVDLNTLTGIFYKNGDFGYNINISSDQLKSEQIDKFLEMEWEALKEYLKFIMHKKTVVIGNIFTNSVNKLIVLNIAYSIGFKVPDTRIISTKNDLRKFQKGKKIITKPISEVMLKITEKGRFLNYTRVLKKNEIFDSYMFPTLIQDYIEKKYEIRTYFLNDFFWSIAIFSQSQFQTKTDYRNYNYDVSNRAEPFLIPNSVKNKIKKLAKQLKLNSGSVDFIYSNSNEFFFLEINPIGQFSNVSSAGNFYIEKFIADKL